MHSEDHWHKIFGCRAGNQSVTWTYHNDLPYHLKTCFFYMYFWEIERLTWGSQDQEYGQVFLLYLFLRNWAFSLRITRSGVVRDWCADKCFWGGRKLLWQIYQSKHIEPFEISFTGKVKTFRVRMSDWLAAWFWELGVPINELFLLCLFQNLQGWIDSLEFHCSFNQHEWI